MKFNRRLAEIVNATPIEKLAKAKDIPPRDLPSNINYQFLGGDFGKQTTQDYNKFVDSEFKGNLILKIFTYDDDLKLVRGSGSLGVTALNQYFRRNSIDLQTVNLREIEDCLRKGTLKLNGTYEDICLVLRSEEKSNEYLAKHLAQQLKTRGYKINPEQPIVIALRDLDLEDNIDAQHDLVFKLRDTAEIKIIPEFAHANDGKKFSVTDSDGIPIFDNVGTRCIWGRSNGLSRLCLYRDLDLYSYDEYLAYSVEGGRVVLRREATRAKIYGDRK